MGSGARPLDPVTVDDAPADVVSFDGRRIVVTAWAEALVVANT